MLYREVDNCLPSRFIHDYLRKQSIHHILNRNNWLDLLLISQTISTVPAVTIFRKICAEINQWNIVNIVAFKNAKGICSSLLRLDIPVNNCYGDDFNFIPDVLRNRILYLFRKLKKKANESVPKDI